ncbi:Tol biopolymer transport system component [Maribacter caenipelagi]|uniref:Tol biopolymer transport system component n=1 Tax=Maribacter caenipelagi TaxID=1447781 RepID=A0A4V3E1Y8_9FLAO|nr:TolB family protein [Maribacter caenipelagi]TDS15178.1 Tol biopolymer transport system component [Maribacter caenipelagi]
MKAHSLFITVLLTFLTIPLNAQHTIGIFDANTNIGDPKVKGTATFNSDEQTYSISGAGTNMWFSSDEFNYVWTTIQGDFILRTTVHFDGKGADPHRKAGWIIKNNLDDNAAHVNASTHGDGLTSLQYRKTVDGLTEEIKSPDNSPTIIQLERRGTTYIMSTAKFGEELTSIQLTDMDLDNEVYVGLYVCSHNPKVLESATFSNVRIIKPVKDDYKPYRDYIGSNLELMDVASGEREIIHHSSHSIQAPNWTVDGKKLIYNSKGHLYNYDLTTNFITPLNTGFAVKNNNDHVLTFDGKLLGISHHNQKDNGSSALYYLPADGSSNPTMVTKPSVGASYLHGWSPNNKEMLFTGERNGAYNIFSVNVKSGKEEQLTDFETLDDGAEYTKNGKFIFFNSVRSGTMQLYRMKVNGKKQTQLTFDEYNDWFPHVSPDQKWIVFISFPKDINPNEHPFYKHCMLRIMPINGGKPKVIAHIYGGQGSINVPSWSPDSKKIAFITNTGSY